MKSIQFFTFLTSSFRSDSLNFPGDRYIRTPGTGKEQAIKTALSRLKHFTGSAVITHDVTTGTGYCLVGFNWIIDFLN